MQCKLPGVHGWSNGNWIAASVLTSGACASTVTVTGTSFNCAGISEKFPGIRVTAVASESGLVSFLTTGLILSSVNVHVYVTSVMIANSKRLKH